MGRLARGGEESLTELSVAFGTGRVTYEPHTPSPNEHDGVSSVLCHVRPSHGRQPPLLPSVRASPEGQAEHHLYFSRKCANALYVISGTHVIFILYKVICYLCNS